MKARTTEEMRVRLSTLWIVAMLNYLYADVIGFFEPEMVAGILAGELGGLQINSALLLGSAVLMEVPIAMVFLSRTLNDTANRWANIITGVVYTAVIFATLSLFGIPAPYYLFFGAVEVAITAHIAWCAWRWRPNEAHAVGAV